MARIGVLALQGAFREHAAALRRLGADVCEVRQLKDMEGLEGMVIPGGESTTIGKLLVEWDMLEPLRRRILDGMPDRELACGFVSGVDEIGSWDAADLFQFRMDTVPILGDLDSILPPLDPDDSRRAAVAGACSIYHTCVHNYVHERSPEILDALYKQGSYSGPSTTARPVCS